MNNTSTRRDFLARAAVTTVALSTLPFLNRSASAADPIQRQGAARLLSSVSAYSFRQHFPGADRDPAASDRPMTLHGFIDFCREHGAVGAELTSYYFPRTDGEYLLSLKRHAFLSGVAISGTAVGNTFTHPPGEQRDQQLESVKNWIKHAAVMGAPHIRVFAGSQQPGGTVAEAKKLCIAALEECADLAGRYGIFLGIENHGGIVSEADDLLDIIRSVQSPWVGINLDTGNFHTEDPYADLAKCAPYSVNVQLKVEMRPRGQPSQPADLARVVAILREHDYQGFVALEYEAAEPGPFEAVPGWLERMHEAFHA